MGTHRNRPLPTEAILECLHFATYQLNYTHVHSRRINTSLSQGKMQRRLFLPPSYPIYQGLFSRARWRGRGGVCRRSRSLDECIADGWTPHASSRDEHQASCSYKTDGSLLAKAMGSSWPHHQLPDHNSRRNCTLFFSRSRSDAQ